MPVSASLDLLSVRDLTDPRDGPHAMQLLIDDVVGGLQRAWRCDVRVVRPDPVVAIADNYDRLGFSPDAVTRDRRYTHYVSDTMMLRSHTSAAVPGAVRELGTGVRDVLLACPGVVYRRDVIDRLHTGTPHQLDLWRIVDHRKTVADLEAMVARVVTILLPGHEHRTVPSPHPYTERGRQIDVRADDEWVEIGECGIAAPHVIAPAGRGGLAMGLGLDRILMLRKGVPDIRLLRSEDPRVASQMLDLAPYRPVSSQPPVQRDLSIAVEADDDAETLGDRVREALGDDADSVETVEVLSETPASELSPAAATRLGIGPDQRNLLVRVVLRNLSRTLTRAEANALRDRVYVALHRGATHQLSVP